MLGRMDDARRLFERLLSLRHDVGLLPRSTTRQAGVRSATSPQAFSHLALVNTAYNLTRVPSLRSSATGTSRPTSASCAARVTPGSHPNLQTGLAAGVLLAALRGNPLLLVSNGNIQAGAATISW
jgi:hypothetical protein